MERREFLKAAAGAGCAGLFGGCCSCVCADNLRYRCQGEVHKDFHASILDGYNYVKDNYGDDAIKGVMRNFAQKVYQQMYKKLKAGDSSELLEYWEWYMTREQGKYTLTKTADGGAVFEVKSCPGRNHLVNRKIAGGEGLCAATKLFNECLTEGTPFTLETVLTSDNSCKQILKRRA